MIRIYESLKMKKPWVEIPRAPNKLLLKFKVIPARIHGEIFAFLCQLAKGPSVQALEIIRHVDASFYRK
jgi:hypothetical protein